LILKKPTGIGIIAKLAIDLMKAFPGFILGIIISAGLTSTVYGFIERKTQISESTAEIIIIPTVLFFIIGTGIISYKIINKLLIIKVEDQ